MHIWLPTPNWTYLTRKVGSLLKHASLTCLTFVTKIYKFSMKVTSRVALIYQRHGIFPLLGIHTEETRRERDTCTPLFITALFIIASTWKQTRCPSADKWIRKQWYIYTMEYYSAIKKDAFEPVLIRWMKLEPIIQSEVRKKNTNTVY